MKKLFPLLVLAVAATSLFAQKDKAAPVELKNSLDSVNYAYGMTLANNLKRVMDKDLNIKLLLAGLNDVVNGTAARISADESTKRFNEYNTKISLPRIAAMWKDENAKFLEENKKRQGVITTASGLQYEVMKKGTGTVSPKASDKVEVHYHGTMTDGQIFDSSVQRGKTSSFGLSQVIPGWTEGLQYMKEGDKFKFFIPYNLAYGEQGRGATIKGFSTLIFEVELFKIMPAESGSNPTATPRPEEASAAACNAEKAAGQAFLTENKKRPGVTTTASGLQYEVLTRSTGTVSPKATDKVEVHYHGTLLNGKVFDSSVNRGETITFGLNQVIKGWTEGLQLMKEGDKFKFFIPSELAYGNNSPGSGIPAGATLVFEVELFKVNPK
jgi:FKBP-type peptidyl-prolyl cis-trans isomerase